MTAVEARFAGALDCALLGPLLGELGAPCLTALLGAFPNRSSRAIMGTFVREKFLPAMHG
jgi:hypothetical protein